MLNPRFRYSFAAPQFTAAVEATDLSGQCSGTENRVSGRFLSHLQHETCGLGDPKFALAAAICWSVPANNFALRWAVFALRQFPPPSERHKAQILPPSSAESVSLAMGKTIMRDSDDIGTLSSDDLWALHETVVELLVGRITERSQELDALLSQLGDRTQPHQQEAP